MTELKILFVEDLAVDVEIAVREIRNEMINFDYRVVDHAAAYQKALMDYQPDLIISDYSMPAFDGMSALKIARSQSRYIPFIILTGSMNEETAVACLKAGANDYVLKEKIKRLPFAVREVLEKRRIEVEKEKVFLQLKQTEESLREIVENSRDIHYKQDLIDKTILFMSPSCHDVLGYSPEELMAMTETEVMELFHAEDLPYLLDFSKDLINSYRQGIRMIEREFRMITRQKETRWIHGYYTVKPDETGTPRYVLGVLQDVTAKKDAELKLRTSEETYRNLFQNAQVGLFRTRIADGKILEGNDQIARMFGYETREQFIAEYITSGNYVDPGTRELMLEKIRSQGFVDNFRARFYRKDRSVFHASYSARISPENGWIEGVLEDITEREQAQMALQRASENWTTTFRSMRDGIALLDEHQRIQQSNKAFQDMVGRSEEELRYGKCFYFIHGSDCPVTNCPYERMKSSKARESIEVEIRGRICDIIVDPIVDQSGAITGAVHVVTDISQRKQMIRELIEAKEKAEESDRLKSAFLANMSHEIRTPMNGILGFTELLKEPNLSGEEQKHFIKVIRKSGDRLLNTVNDLIDISRIETGLVPMVICDVDIHSELEGLISFFLPQALQKGLHLSLIQPTFSKNTRIRTDRGKLDSILSNLIRNAIKYTPSGEISVACLMEGNRFRFMIKDTGIGVPADRREAIFDRFVQADISDTRAFQGSGLGLSIAKAYVEMLGGTIGVESEEGVGSTFWFVVPETAPGAVHTEPLPAEPVKKTPDFSVPDKRRKVLVAEDDEDSYFYLATLLENLNCETIRSVTGTETVEKCRIHPDLDLVLMDIKMPLMDGYEATRKIREFNSEVVIIAQTAYALSGDKERALTAGCNDYVAKPVSKDKVVGFIRSLT